MLSWPSFEALDRGRSFPLLEQPSTSIPPVISHSGAHTPDHYTPVLINARTGTRQPGTAPVLQSPLKVFKLSNPKTSCSDLPVPSSETMVQVLGQGFPLSLCPVPDGSIPKQCCVLCHAPPRELWAPQTIKAPSGFSLLTYSGLTIPHPK